MNSFSGGIAAIHKKWFMLGFVLFCLGRAASQTYHDVSLQHSASPAIAQIGDTLVFTIQVFNEGQSDLTGLAVKTLLPGTVSFVSYSASPATFFNVPTGQWSIGSALSQGVSSLFLEIKTVVLAEGVVYAIAQVSAMNQVDVDSSPGNDFLPEDDMMAACASIPHKICTVLGETVTITAPGGYTGYEWYLDAGNGPVAIANGQVLIASQPGSYTFSILGNGCPQGLCCPVILEENCHSNQPPVAVQDEAATPPGTPVQIVVLENDSDPDDGLDPGSVTVTSSPNNGTASVNPDGSITYLPDPGFTGLDTFIYQVCDTGVSLPVQCDTALVIVTVGDIFFDLALTKALSPNQPNPVDIGDVVAYTLTVTNEGHFPAANIVVLDHIPPGLVLAPNNPGWSLDANGKAVFTIAGPLEPGHVYEVEIKLIVQYGASGQTIVNFAEVSSATDVSGNISLDVDSTPGNGDPDEDDMDTQPIELVPHDPTGYIYCDKTGVIITGGTISVQGPGQVFIIHDGSTGYYEFFTDGTPGTYHLSYNHPDGLVMSDDCLPQPNAFDPTGLGQSVTLGSGANANGTYLADTTCAANPFYLSFELEPGDPPVFNNNLPFQCCFIGSIVCQDEGNGQQDGNEPGMPGVTVHLYDCADTLNPIMSTITGADGNYAFDGLLAGSYMVQFVLPPDSRFAEGANVNASGFSDCLVLDFGECDTTTSACILICPSVNAGPDLEVCAGHQVALQAFLPYGNGSLLWSPATALSDPTILSPLANPLTTTTYTLVYDDGLGCSSTDTVVVSVVGNCLDNLLVEDTVTIQANCAHGDPLFCFDVPYEQLSDYAFTLNGEPYDAEFGPCNYLRERYYAIGALSSLGNGNFRLDNWTVNGVKYSTDFQNAAELVALMNNWDPMGGWDLHPSTFSLAGGVRQSYYSSLQIRDLNRGTIYEFTLYQFYAPNSSYLILPEGEHDLVITRLSDGVTDSVFIRSFCVTPDFVEIVLPVGGLDTICFDLSELAGTPVAIFNPCLDGIDQSAEMETQAGATCIDVFGMFPGDTEACYVVCDDLGVCDTTYILVAVHNDDLVLVPDSLCTPKDVPIVGEVLLNDHISNDLVSVGVIVPPNHGTVLVNPDNTMTYIPDEGYCNDGGDEPFDEFVYEVCTRFGCASTTVTVQVKCDGLVVFNGFSPNGDGVNDFFKIEGLGAYETHKIMVFNRWGNKVFQSENYRNDWNGYWDTERLPSGTYFYLIELNGGKTWLSGYLQILW